MPDDQDRQVDAPQRVLVTGSHGFTGRYVAASLRRHGYRVLGTSTAKDAVPHPDIGAGDTYAMDLRDPRQVRAVIDEARPHAVIHLAGVAFVAHGSPADFYQVNVIGTRHLLHALAESDAPLHKVIVASSANVYGNAGGGRLDESTPLAPANDYAVSKVALEFVTRLWFDRLPLLVTRPFNYTGVDQARHFLLPKLVEHFGRKARQIELGNIEVARDFSDVRDIAEAYLGLLQSPATNETVNLCSGHCDTLQTLLEICEDITGHPLTVHVNPALVRANEIKALWGDNHRLKTLVPGWQPRPINETLAWMIKEELQHKRGGHS